MQEGFRLLALAVLAQAMDDATMAPSTIKTPAWAVRRHDTQLWLCGDDPWLLFWLSCAGIHPDRIRARLLTVLEGQQEEQAVMSHYFREGVLV